MIQLQAFDEHMNLVLGEVEESHTVNDRDPVTGEEIVQVRNIKLEQINDCTFLDIVSSIAINLKFMRVELSILFADNQAHNGNAVCER